MNIINKILIKLSSQKVGSDEFNNEYYQNKNGKRFVVYQGIAEPSKVPAEWHGWLHYSSDLAPVKINTGRLPWQKIHIPNMTGTKEAYSPKNSSSKNTNQDYQAWQPNN